MLQARGFKLACVTNKPREFTLDLLERVGLVDYFDVVISGDDTVEKKPHAAPVLAACERLEVSPAEAVMIGDSENDLLSARAAGCRAILVEGGYNEGQPVASLPADAIVETLTDAVQLIAAPASLITTSDDSPRPSRFLFPRGMAQGLVPVLARPGSLVLAPLTTDCRACAASRWCSLAQRSLRATRR